MHAGPKGGEASREESEGPRAGERASLSPAERSALSSRWPTLHVFGACLEDLQAARARVESVVGAVPQLDEIEPFDPTDPEESWELRIVLPGLDASLWCALRSALVGVEHELSCGISPGVREARDLGALIPESLGALADSRPTPRLIPCPLNASRFVHSPARPSPAATAHVFQGLFHIADTAGAHAATPAQTAGCCTTFYPSSATLSRPFLTTNTSMTASTK